MLTRALLFSAGLALLGAVLISPLTADDRPKLSTIAPIDDLLVEVDAKIASLEEALKDNETFLAAKKKSIPQDAGMLAIFAQAIAEHDSDSPLKSSAPNLRDAAKAMGAAADLAAAQAAMAQIKQAKSGEVRGAQVAHEWNKLAPLGQVMNEVNARNGALRKAFRKLPVADAEARSRDAEVLALIGVVVAADTHEVKEASRIPKWQEYSHDMTASMGKVATALKANDGMAAKAAFLESAKSCNACHNDFRDH